ncbi:glycerol-3-phosphate acyltransferase [Lyngbya aestuarii]|uniref:glycerol-3-phosphate acyltransferase n=1 Tax=Lyngbya aestuarii TaxID=118322 RepID=UPI00058FB282|nr:glycerol-3-phosphate acyltransferase [Lyngbya aestuarii]
MFFGKLIVFILSSFSLGALPLTHFVVKILTGIDLTQVGTGNVSVAAAFTHAGKKAGIAAVLAEIARGILPILLAKAWFPGISALELVGLIFLVLGRYFVARGGGVTNATWGTLVYSVTVTLSTIITGLVIWQIGRLVTPSHPTQARLRAVRWGCLSGPFWVGLWRIPFTTSLADFLLEILAAIGLAVTLVVINLRQGDDFGLYKKQRLLTLSDPLDETIYGAKASRLSQLKRAGFKVPSGWVLPAFKLKTQTSPKLSHFSLPIPNANLPLIVRSSAIGEDSENNSAAGQYQTIGPVTTETELIEAIDCCRQSYWSSEAISYRRQRQIPDEGIAILIQPYISSKAAGVMFSRHPLDGSTKVIIEALPGGAESVVGGKFTPLHLEIDFTNLKSKKEMSNVLKNSSLLPRNIIAELVKLAQDIEVFYHGLPQDIEWGWDEENIWILQSRPITNLRPIWTRTIASEVIPGTIPPLTWSINRPLTCGVWGEIFTLVLGEEKAASLDFKETATLLGSHAYFNATLLGAIFRMMGLPEQGLEFLLRGQKMGKPPLSKVLPSLPGLLRLVRREMILAQSFQRDYRQTFLPALNRLKAESNNQSSPLNSQSLTELLDRTERIQELLKSLTYYNILGPIGLAIRRTIFRVSDEWLPTENNPEVMAMCSLQTLADKFREQISINETASLSELEQQFNQISDLQVEFTEWLNTYGYLSEVGTNIAVLTWKEQPEVFQKSFLSMIQNPTVKVEKFNPNKLSFGQRWRLSQCRERAIIKGKIAEAYGKLLANLRWTFLAIAEKGIALNLLDKTDDIFFLEFAEIQDWIRQDNTGTLKIKVKERREKFEQNQTLKVPNLVYGNTLPKTLNSTKIESQNSSIFTGIPASVGCVEGIIQICRSIGDSLNNSSEKYILVVPYTDAGWAPLLINAQAIISEVGGQLSHGAIIAREYRIPAVMNIPNAVSLFRNGQRVRVDGYQGTVEILAEN